MTRELDLRSQLCVQARLDRGIPSPAERGIFRFRNADGLCCRGRRGCRRGCRCRGLHFVRGCARPGRQEARGSVHPSEGNGVLHRSHRAVTRFRPPLSEWHKRGPCARVCASQGDTDPRASSSPSLALPRTQRRPRRRRPRQRQRQPRWPRQMSVSALRNLKSPPLGRTLGPPDRLLRSNHMSYLYGGSVANSERLRRSNFLSHLYWGSRGAEAARRSATREATRIPILLPRSLSAVPARGVTPILTPILTPPAPHRPPQHQPRLQARAPPPPSPPAPQEARSVLRVLTLGPVVSICSL